MALTVHCVWGCKLAESMEIIVIIPQKQQLGLPYDPDRMLLGISSKDAKSGDHRETTCSQ